MMNSTELKKALDHAARLRGGRLDAQKPEFHQKVNKATRHDIKLELDVQCQNLIERRLLAVFLDIGLLGEEGESETDMAERRWVVDPIDGTVNFAYGIPHACVSIALQQRGHRQTSAYHNVVGVIYDPFADELWTAIRGQPAWLNGRGFT